MGTPGGLLAVAAGVVLTWAGITGKDAWGLVRDVVQGKKKLPKARSEPPTKLSGDKKGAPAAPAGGGGTPATPGTNPARGTSGASLPGAPAQPVLGPATRA